MFEGRLRSYFYYLGICIGLLTGQTQLVKGQESGIRDHNFQVKGSPNIIHYNRDDFDSDPQFWAVAEDSNGLLYFGNNDGALVFDGEQWHKVTLPNHSSIRSLVADSLGNMYAGGFDEFGLIKKDEVGQFYFESLIDTLKFEDPSISNLWQVHNVKGYIVYRSFSQLIVINGNRFTALPASSFFIKSFQVGEEYLVQDQDEGIFKLDLEEMSLEKYFDPEQYQLEELISILPTAEEGMAMGIGKTGKVFHLNLEKKTSILSNRLFPDSGLDQVESAIKTKNGHFYLGTLGHGILKLDEMGNVIQTGFDYQNLQDNSVLNLYETKEGNIWALLNNGLDCITVTSPITTIYEGASLYDVVLTENEMYLATNQGVFFSNSPNASQPDFIKVQGLEGQAWTMGTFKGDVLVSHNKGLFKIDQTRVEQIGDMNGIWKVIPLKGRPNQFLAASYSGLYVLSKEANSNWKVLRKIEGFEESSRDIRESEKPGTFWICHGYKGVFRVRLDEDYTKMTSFEHFTTQNGLNIPYNVNVFVWEGNTVFTTNDGIYSYNSEENEFQPFAQLNKILDPSKNTRTLFQDGDKTWFVQDDEAGYFLTKDSNPKLETGYFLPFKGEFNQGMECIVPISSDKVLLGTKKGLYLDDLTYSSQNLSATTIISSAKYVTEEGEQNWIPLENGDQIQLNNKTSSILFNFASPNMQKGIDVQYAYKLENADRDWSDWQFEPFKDYSHLRPGNYMFKVRSRSMLGIEGEEASLRFQILPLWYQTNWAVAGYILIGTLVFILVGRVIRNQIHEENQKHLEDERKEKKLLELELKQLKLEAEKDKISRDKSVLEENVIYKSKELANYTMLLVKKKEIFAEILEDIKEVRKVVRNEMSRKKLQQIFSKLNQHAIGEEYTNVFEANFEHVHSDFFKSLKEKFPDLSQRELRLCAFIKMNLTNKEISPLLNISVRGVETARYRVRKKLNLEHVENFIDFLESIERSASVE